MKIFRMIHAKRIKVNVMKKWSCTLLWLVIVVSSAAVGYSRQSESFLEPFQRNLMDSFIGPMRADGKEVTPRHRAMFMGYILNRQEQRTGTYDRDKRLMNDLVAEVKGFLASVSPDNDLWPVVEAGMRGEYNQEVNALLGGSAFVTEIFPTLDGLVGDWRKGDYDSNRFYNHPENEEILKIPETFLRMMKGKQYEEALKLTAGRCLEQFKEMLSEASDSPQSRDRFNQYFDNLEWKAGLAGMTDTKPPMVKIIFALRDRFGDWEEDPCIMILDDGVWKIARFID